MSKIFYTNCKSNNTLSETECIDNTLIEKSSSNAVDGLKASIGQYSDLAIHLQNLPTSNVHFQEASGDDNGDLLAIIDNAKDKNNTVAAIEEVLHIEPITAEEVSEVEVKVITTKTIIIPEALKNHHLNTNDLSVANHLVRSRHINIELNQNVKTKPVFLELIKDDGVAKVICEGNLYF
jgi:hypothetical protein